MKKLLISILIYALAIALCACSVKTTTYPEGKNKQLSSQFTVIKAVKRTGDNACYYLYDNETKIVYLYTAGGYHATMCPYYIIENGEPTIAIYGVNYYVEN